jgi:alkylhydroperoxidase/carboxymuconolactone decarboxylase family protein YurZ
MPEHPLATMMKVDPALIDLLKTTDEVVYSDGALSRKTKLLMALAFDAAHGAANGVRALAQSALKAGATQQEIAEAVRVAYHLSGVGSVYTAAQGLREVFT